MGKETMTGVPGEADLPERPARGVASAARGGAGEACIRGGYGGCKYSVPCYLHRTRHVPGVIKHDAVVISSHVYHHSQLPCDVFTAFFDISRFDDLHCFARKARCRSTPDASLSVQDASWAPHTPKSAMWRLRSHFAPAW